MVSNTSTHNQSAMVSFVCKHWNNIIRTQPSSEELNGILFMNMVRSPLRCNVSCFIFDSWQKKFIIHRLLCHVFCNGSSVSITYVSPFKPILFHSDAAFPHMCLCSNSISREDHKIVQLITVSGS